MTSSDKHTFYLFCALFNDIHFKLGSLPIFVVGSGFHRAATFHAQHRQFNSIELTFSFELSIVTSQCVKRTNCLSWYYSHYFISQ